MRVPLFFYPFLPVINFFPFFFSGLTQVKDISSHSDRLNLQYRYGTDRIRLTLMASKVSLESIIFISEADNEKHTKNNQDR
jgi:hypothetical protein